MFNSNLINHNQYFFHCNKSL